MTRLVIAIGILSAIIAGLIGNVAHAQESTTTRGILSDGRLGPEDDVYTAALDVQSIESNDWTRLYISFLNSYESLPRDGEVEVLTRTLDTVEFFQNDTLYTAAIYVPVKHAVMLAIAGQKGDPSFDNAWFDLANDCTVIAVVDDANDPISPYIYTRLACQLTDAQIENIGESLGDALLAITPLYTIAVPIVTR